MNRPIHKTKQSRSTLSLLWYLLYLSKNHDVNVTWLYRNLVEATTSQKFLLGGLTVEYRGKVDDSQIFLITDESGEFIRQLLIPQKMLEDNTLLKIMESQGISRLKSQNHKDFLDLLVKTR